MIEGILKRFSGTHYKRFLKQTAPVVARINQLEQEYQALTDEQLRAKTDEFRARFRQQMDAFIDGIVEPKLPKKSEAELAALDDAARSEYERERKKAIDEIDAERSAQKTRDILDEILPEAFATVKNAARRLCGREIEFTGVTSTWDMVHYDVQLIGGIALHQGKIAEMATGEGKTLVSTLPLYLNALSGRNCQLVTVNEYLAQRDAEWMGHLFKFLGLTVGVIKNMAGKEDKQAAYGSDITYGTASEFGFDYLRDNGMAQRKESMVQKDHYFCIVDEIDSILIDEARTPLIISGPAPEERQAPYMEMKPAVEKLVRLQTNLCKKLAQEAETELKKEEPDTEEAFPKLLQVRQGMPKNKILMRLMEDGNIRRPFEKYEAEMGSDFMKKPMFELKENLFFTIDEKQHSADLTENGRQAIAPDDPNAFLLPDLPTAFMEIERDPKTTPEEKQEKKQEQENLFATRAERIHCVGQLLRAYSLYERDVEYMVADGKVVIIDQNTGRAMPGRRWSDGLHQAVEAKENCKIEKETKTYATITIQNYFRLYEKLAGMTGTAETEAGEFHDIYKLDVMVIPTNKPCIRVDDDDEVYKTQREKYTAVMDDIEEAHKKGQPILVGTASVDTSEALSRMLKKKNITHSVLNAKYHQQEADIVSRAGQPGAVTIATNMAGRGTDIKLGEGVREKGGLLVLGTERHESRRIDRQLRGRCSRQGDPGHSKFYVSLEDDLMRLFANAGPISKLLQQSFSEGEVLTGSKLLNRSIEQAQKKREQMSFSARKRLLQFDDVLNRQREVVYDIRTGAITGEEPAEAIFEMVEEEVDERLSNTPLDHKLEDNDRRDFLTWLNSIFPVSLKEEDIAEMTAAELRPFVMERVHEAYEQKKASENPEHVTEIERVVIMRAIDRNWQDHLTEMEDLRQAVGLRGYGQRDPLQEYKTEGYRLFEEMMGRVRQEICRGLFRTTTNIENLRKTLAKMHQQAQTTGPDEGAVASGPAGEAVQRSASGKAVPAKKAAAKTAAKKGAPDIKLPPAKKKAEPVKRELPKIGRNEVVTIRKGDQSQSIKWKKAEPLVRNEGWEIEEPVGTK